MHLSTEQGNLDAFAYPCNQAGTDVFVITVSEHWIRAPKVSIKLDKDKARELAGLLVAFANNKE